MHLTENVLLTMRDGVRLATDIYRPARNGRPLDDRRPVLLHRTPYNKVVALNAEDGTQLWSYDPKAYEDGQPPNGTGFVHRGVAAWRNDAALRIFMNSRYRLIALDGRTGRPIETFGDHGVVDLARGLVWEINKKHYTNTSPPIVYKNLVIVGNGVGDRLVYRNDPPGDVRAVVLADDVEAEVDSGGCAGRGQDLAVVDVQHVGIDLDPGVGPGE